MPMISGAQPLVATLLMRASGFNRVRVDGQSVSLDEPITLSARRKHKVEVVVDRVTVRRSTRSRLADSIEAALDLGRASLLLVGHLAFGAVLGAVNQALQPVQPVNAKIVFLRDYAAERDRLRR